MLILIMFAGLCKSTGVCTR